MKKDFIKKLGFLPKENSNNIFLKMYENNYILEVDFEKEIFDYGNKIKAESKTTQNFSQSKNWVVFECVNRLLEKGYNAEDIILEKTYKLGHLNKGRLDILVKKEGKSFLMIECKTWGKEFEKELKNMGKDGGQLFSYFQQDKDSEYIMLYASNENLEYKNEIIKIEDSYRETSNVIDFYTRWNKLTKQNGIFENWIKAYDFESRALTLNDLEDIKEEDASYIFNRFLEILRHNTVSDKPNAFNKIFTLFLCKIYDEGHKRPSDELDFQWVEGKDNHVKFQMKLADLYKNGMKDLLNKEVTDFSNKEFEEQFGSLISDPRQKQKLLERIMELRLQKNNEFAIKEVFDEETFLDNAKVLKEVVELLQNYKIRYTKKQPFLGDFFELLLTTGLKQEAGQFFTPVPVARFLCKSIPIKYIIEKKLENGDVSDLLPVTIDYASGSGHFLTESMEEIQNILKEIPKNDLRPNVSKYLKSWDGNFEWAYDYMYGIEKDYRLVKTAKVGCFLHGDGIANVIHGDGLDSFEKSKNYRGKLKHFNKNDKSQNEAFDLVLSNPPYSVSSFKGNLKKEQAEKDFKLFDSLTDNSSEIEALFIERTSQLLKEGGIAGIILPSSILSNTGIYTKAREIILKDFEIIAITELGSNTFMATGTNTVVLFLRKRNKFFAQNLDVSVNNFFENKQDITLNGIEYVVSKYVSEVWEGLNFEDYKSLLEKSPNENISNHEIFKDYKNKIKSKKLIEEILEIEKEKLFYFVLAYSQKVILVKSGEKKIEKEFLGYEFSARKGSEGIHAMQRGKQIDECTKLFDPENSENPDKASTYIFDAFNNNFDRQISEELKNHIFRTNLSDLLTFDRTDFEKTISLNLKKKIKIESKWEVVKLGKITKLYQPKTITSNEIKDNGEYKVFGANGVIGYYNKFNHENEEVLITCRGATCGKINFSEKSSRITGNAMVSSPIDKNILNKRYLLNYLMNIDLSSTITGTAQPQITRTNLENFPIPLPPKDIQQKIVDEIGKLEKDEEINLEKILKLDNKIKTNLENIDGNFKKLSELVYFKNGLNYDRKSKGDVLKIVGVKDFQEHFSPILSDLEKIQINGNLSENYELANNDLLVVRSNGSKRLVGRFLYINDLNEKISFSGFTIRLRLFSENNSSKFLCYFLKTDKIRNELFNKSDGSNIKSLNQTLLGNLIIPLPSLEKQKEIVGKIEILEEKIEKLKQENKNIPEKKKEILEKYL